MVSALLIVAVARLANSISIRGINGLIVTIGYFNWPVEIVGFADIHQHGILVAFAIIIKPDIGLAKTIVSPVMRPVRKAAVAGGSAARTGAGAADIAVIKKMYSTIYM